MQQLLNSEREVITFAAELGLPTFFPRVGPEQVSHRTVIDGMLWVQSSGASWRDLPEEEFGPWHTIYYRYNRWRKEGLWQGIGEALRCQR